MLYVTEAMRIVFTKCGSFGVTGFMFRKMKDDDASFKPFVNLYLKIYSCIKRTAIAVIFCLIVKILFAAEEVFHVLNWINYGKLFVNREQRFFSICWKDDAFCSLCGVSKGGVNNYYTRVGLL